MKKIRRVKKGNRGVTREGEERDGIYSEVGGVEEEEAEEEGRREE